jgi:hypothetical protein
VSDERSWWCYGDSTPTGARGEESHVYTEPRRATAKREPNELVGNLMPCQTPPGSKAWELVGDSDPTQSPHGSGPPSPSGTVVLRPQHHQSQEGSQRMALSAETRPGPYEILEPLGAAWEGEVYAARDSRHGREVTVEVPSEDLT